MPKKKVAHWPPCAEWTARAHNDHSTSAASVREPDPKQCTAPVSRALGKWGYVNRNPKRQIGKPKETKERVGKNSRWTY